MHIDPIKDAARHFDAIDSATDRLIRAELHAMSVFNGAIRTGDANAIVPLLPCCRIGIRRGARTTTAQARQSGFRL